MLSIVGGACHVVAEQVDCSNDTITAIILSIVVVLSGNRFFGEWKEKMDYGRCVKGRQSMLITILTCHIPMNVGLTAFQLNQCKLITAYSTLSTLCDHTID